jgi:hypothetical protein
LSVSAPKSGTHRTRAATEAQLARFKTPGERTEYFRALGQKSAEGRLMLSADDRQALGQAYTLLSKIAQRHGFDPTDQAA